VPTTAASQDLELWKRWKRRQDSQALDGLLGRLSPILAPRADHLVAVSGLPRSVVDWEIKKQAIRALETYDPHRAQLSTHVISRLPKANRILDYASPTRIPEERRLKVRSFRSAETELRTRFNREPTTIELMDELHWPEREIRTIRKELRPMVSAERAPEGLPPLEDSKREVSEAIEWLAYDLTPDEQLVFEHVTGWGGRPRVRGPALAQKLGKSDYEIRKLRETVARKVGRHLEMVI
jgi:hypothetical protein